MSHVPDQSVPLEPGLRPLLPRLQWQPGFYPVHRWITSAPAGSISQVFCLKEKIFNGGAAVLRPEFFADALLKIRTATDYNGSGSSGKHFSKWMSLPKLCDHFPVYYHKKLPRSCVAGTWRHHGGFQHPLKIFLGNGDVFFVFSNTSSFTNHF